MGNNNKRTAETFTISSNSKIEIVLLGDLNVGKSSLAYTYQTGKFNVNYKPPTGSNSYRIRYAVRDKTVDLNICEPVNHKQFPRVWPTYVRMSDGVLLLYDVTDPKTLDSLLGLLRILKKHNPIALVFLGNYKPPVGTTSFEKRLVIREKTVDLYIWEPINHKTAPHVWPEYVRKSDGVLLLYDVSDVKSLKSLSRLPRIIKKHNSVAVIFLVGTKSDCEDGIQLSHEIAEDFAESENLEFLECSAKSGENVNKVFEDIVLRILQTKNLVSLNENEESLSELDEIYQEGKSQSELKLKNVEDNWQLLLPSENLFLAKAEKEFLISEENEEICSLQIESKCKDGHPPEECSQLETKEGFSKTDKDLSQDDGHSSPIESDTMMVPEEVVLLEGKCTTWYIEQK